MKESKLGLILVGIILISILAGGAYLYTSDHAGLKTSKNDTEGKKKKKDKKDKEKDAEETTNAACSGGFLKATQVWDMPKELLEISGMAWLSTQKVAAVQDNEGSIYIYDLPTKRLERKISFGPTGDYEGIAYVNQTFFIVRSDGRLFEVSSAGKLLKQHNLPLTETDNIETLHYDVVNNRLILGQKDGKKGKAARHFYSFDLASKKFNPTPIFSIRLDDPIISCRQEDAGNGKKKDKKKSGNAEIRPSELAIHPTTKEIYIADGPNQRILVLSPDAKPKHYLFVDKNEFPQVEGLLFNQEGELFVSTEGTKNPAKIAKMQATEN